MKKHYLLLLFCFSINSLFSQTIEDVFTTSKLPMDFVGLDFSNVKLIGSEGFSDPAKIQSYYFNTWNGLMISEEEKYNIKKAFMKSDVDYHLGVVEALNGEVDYIDLVTNETPANFSDKELQAFVKRYNTDGLEHKLGISFIVHSLNKFQERAYVYVVIFNTKSKKVLFSKRMSGEARGFGFRNYWMGAIYDIIKDISNTQFRKWKKEFQKKKK